MSVFYDTVAEELWGAISPDGLKLAYLVQLEEYSNDIYVVDMSSTQTTRLTDNFYQEQSPVWDPNNETIYYTTFTTDPPSIKAIDIDGSNERGIYLGDYGIKYITLGNLQLFLPISQ